MHLTIAILICFLWQVFGSVTYRHFEFVAVAIALFVYGVKHKLCIPRVDLLLTFLAVHTFMCLLAGTLSVEGFAVQFFSVALSYIYFYNIVRCYSLEKIMKKYCLVAFGFAIFALFQEIAAVLGDYTLVQLEFLVKGMKVVHIYGPLIRVEGLCTEPFNFALLLLPALYCAMRTYLVEDYRIYSRGQAFLVVVAYALTFSAAGMIAWGAAVVLLLMERRSAAPSEQSSVRVLKSMTLVVVIVVSFAWAYCNIPMITMRVDDTVDVFLHSKPLELSGMSTYAIASNLQVATDEFISSLGLGVGFGSYGANYLKHSTSLDSTFYMFGINKLDGSGIIIRFVGELGAFGIGVLIWFFIRYRRNVRLENKWISNAVLTQLILRCIRLGNYTIFGMGLIVCIYAEVGSRNKLGRGK